MPATQARKIFISYRREDTADVTGRVHDRLREKYGSEAIFTDVDSVPFGADFREHLDEEVSQCDVLLAVIGRSWVSIADEDGQRRLDSPTDFVRIEIESALSRKIPVVPLLAHGVSMPSPDDLPEPLKALAFRNGTPVRPNPDFHNDMDRLIRGLEKFFSRQDEKSSPKRDVSDTPRAASDQVHAKEYLQSAEVVESNEQVVTAISASQMAQAPGPDTVDQPELTKFRSQDIGLAKFARMAWHLILAFACGWGVGWFVRFAGANLIGNWGVSSAVGTAVGGLATGLILRRVVPSMQLRHVFLIVVGWVIGWAASMIAGEIVGWTLAGSVGWAIGGIATGLVLSRVASLIQSMQVFLIAVGWAMGSAVVEVVAQSAEGMSLEWGISWAIGWAVGGAVGGAYTLWHLRHALAD